MTRFAIHPLIIDNSTAQCAAFRAKFTI